MYINLKLTYSINLSNFILLNILIYKNSNKKNLL